MIKSKYKLLNDKELANFVKNSKGKGKTIALTSGSWDMLHVGHMRYIETASKQADVLIIGVDSDKKIKIRKGEDRPVVSQNERVEMLSHLGYADAIYIKTTKHTPNELIKLVKPDVLIVSKTTGHSDKKYQEIQKLCKKILVLESQAKTSTTARIRLLHINGKKELANKLAKEIPALIDKLIS